MTTLVAECPRCRSEADTGIAADHETMQELGPALSVLVLCDGCRDYRKMMVEDIFFAPDSRELAA